MKKVVKMFKRMNIEKKSCQPGFYQKIAKPVKERRVFLEKILVCSLLELSSEMIRRKKSSKSRLLGNTLWKIDGAFLGIVLKTKTLNKTDSNICSILWVVRQLFLCPPPPPLSQWYKIWAYVFLHRSLNLQTEIS